MAHDVPAGLTPAEGRRFGLQVGLAFLVLAGIAWWRGHTTAAAVLAGPGLLLLAAGVLLPGRLGPLYRAWMRMALAISRVTSPILMSVVYLLVLTPMGLLLRAFGHRPLSRRPDGASYWVGRAGSPRTDMRRQF